ncbi:MAG: hypothetical protein A2945_05385 [Candidatus Liptonbacteria bacterium RIFCSPLOWO2_01_FULL_52_25]|uniref:DinB-like domain-containing protein n=1 Tax=Candidatus Liptonbacteria bacterium RIFCSPLOWO2_01_FULL_52_25 TaxID=1798650 RepID=A0A1G2CEF3_9BACT|nr:MAG: hypothetical protein A2945_05385 [Candidatus Liptonbacteria bacterium RIFCSPLOWO2_01_FULL_52_25]
MEYPETMQDFTDQFAQQLTEIYLVFLSAGWYQADMPESALRESSAYPSIVMLIRHVIHHVLATLVQFYAMA